MSSTVLCLKTFNFDLQIFKSVQSFKPLHTKTYPNFPYSWEDDLYGNFLPTGLFDVKIRQRGE
jgi:hypothetical protein